MRNATNLAIKIERHELKVNIFVSIDVIEEVKYRYIRISNNPNVQKRYVCDQ